MINEDEIDLFELFQKLYKEKWLIIGITVFFAVISLVITLLIPKAYKAEALYEIKPVGSYTIVDSQGLIETVKFYEKHKNPQLEVKLIQLRRSKNIIKIEAEGVSPEIAKHNLENVVNLINKELFKEKFNEIAENVKKRLDIINNTLGDLKRSGIIYDPSRVADLITEKQELEKWLKNPVVICPVSEIITSYEPVKPKPLLNLSVGIVSGLFIGIFVALLKEAIKERKAR